MSHSGKFFSVEVYTLLLKVIGKKYELQVPVTTAENDMGFEIPKMHCDFLRKI